MNDGRISIFRPHYDDGHQAIEIELRGDDERVGVVIEIDMTSFAKALTGGANQPCHYQLKAWRTDGRSRKKDNAPTLPLEGGNA